MTRLRAVASVAAVLTALLLQATLVGPVAGDAPVSLPAVLVVAVALVDGPAAGLVLGFTAGLLADLGSRHPAGVLALTWLLLGVVAGALAGPRSVRSDAAIAGALAGAAAVAASVLLIAVHADGVTLAALARTAIPATLVDAIIAVPVVAAVRRALRNDALAPAQPVVDLVRVTGRV